MKNISGDTSTWNKGTEVEELELPETPVEKPIFNIDPDVKKLEKIVNNLDTLYTHHPKKHLYDAVVTLKSSLDSLNHIIRESSSKTN